MSQIKEALFYKSLPDSKVQCTLCPWNCCISPGRAGFCGVRKNIEGKLYTLIYGQVSSLAVDPIEKKPLYHFYPGTEVLSVGTYGCNMHCGHCQNWHISHVVLAESVKKGKTIRHNSSPPTEFISPENLIAQTKAEHAAGIAWTYNEPTIWFEYAYDSAVLAKAAGLYTIFVSNGYISFEALDMIGPYLGAFRVDVKAFNKEAYFKLTRVRDFTPVLLAAERAKKKWNMHVEIVTLVVPTLNDDAAQLKGIAEWIAEKLGVDTPWHVTRFMPCLEFSHLLPTPIETLEKAQRIGLDAGLQFVYIGNVAGHAANNTYCPKCGKLVIERIGFHAKIKNLADGHCGFCQTPLNIRTGLHGP